MDRIFVNPKFERIWVQVGLNRFDEIVSRFLPDYRKRQKVTVRRVSIPDGHGSTDAFFKLYHHRPGGWRFWLRMSKARAEFAGHTEQPLHRGRRRLGHLIDIGLRDAELFPHRAPPPCAAPRRPPRAPARQYPAVPPTPPMRDTSTLACFSRR